MSIEASWMGAGCVENTEVLIKDIFKNETLLNNMLERMKLKINNSLKGYSKEQILADYNESLCSMIIGLEREVEFGKGKDTEADSSNIDWTEVVTRLYKELESRE